MTPRPPGTLAYNETSGAHPAAEPSRGGCVRHCHECDRDFPDRHEICPDCWELLGSAPRDREPDLTLVFASDTLYEAEMVEDLLHNEGIPCLKVPGPGAALWPLGIASPLNVTRIYVPGRAEALARSLIAEIGHRPA
jgi:hypothetical protein